MKFIIFTLPKESYVGRASIEGKLKVNGIEKSREIYLYIRKTRKLVASTFSDQNGNYRFDNLNPDVEFDIIARDFEKQFKDDLLIAVKPKL